MLCDPRRIDVLILDYHNSVNLVSVERIRSVTGLNRFVLHSYIQSYMKQDSLTIRSPFLTFW